MKRSCTFAIAISLCLAAVVAATVPSSAQAPKSGGHLNLMQREDLSQGFAIHETSTIATSFPSMPCFNNLVVFDQSKRAETVDNLVGELAEAVLPSQVARRPAVHLEGREVHLRHGARGARGGRQAPDQSA